MDMELEPTLDPQRLRVEDWGLIDYRTGLACQLELLEKVASGVLPSTLVFCSHPSIVTLGRASTMADVGQWKGDVEFVSRGGRATYHGPGQLVIYPIFNLNHPRKGVALRDVHGYLRWLENLVMGLLGELGLAAYTKQALPGEISATGVWVGERKVASIGVAVKKWITYHGAAINLDRDPLAFSGISPCGYQPATMTSVEELVGHKVPRDFWRRTLAREF